MCSVETETEVRQSLGTLFRAEKDFGGAQGDLEEVPLSSVSSQE